MKKGKESPSVMILLFVSVLLLGLVVLIARDTGIDSAHHSKLDEGWLVTVNGQRCAQTKMSALVFPLANRGDELTLETTLPQRVVSNPVFIFYSVHSTVLVELDGKEIYRYGQELYEQGKLVGYGYHYIDLPEDYEGKKLCVRLTVCEDAAFSSFDTPMLYDANWYIRDYLKENQITLMIDLFLIVFGICMTGVSFVFIFRLRGGRWMKLLWASLFSFGIGCWSLCSYNLTFLFFENLRWKVFMEFGMLYLLPISVFAYFYEEAMRTDKKGRKYGYWLILAAQLLFTLTAYLLQITGVCHFPKVLRIQHLIMAVMAVYLIVMFVSDIRHKRTESAVLFAGAVIMILFAAADLLRFNIEKYVSLASGKRYVGMFSIGVMIFITALLLDFGRSVTRALYDAAKGKALEELAYSDALTGLANRRSCEDFLDALDTDGADRQYAVGVFDLNNLKKVNDRLGHEEGDAFIRAFGEILREVFAPFGLVGRTGGDEFLVVLKNVSSEETDALIDRMNRLIQSKNEQHESWSLSAAYGICRCDEEPGRSARQLYRLADERMYECKREMKLRG